MQKGKVVRSMWFCKYCKEAVSLRIDRICANFVNTSKEYKALSLNHSRMIDELKRRLSHQDLDLVFELEAVETRMQAAIEDALYRQGIKDGIRIANAAGKIRKM